MRADNDTKLHVMYDGGGVVWEPFRSGARAVAQGNATVIERDGAPVLPKVIVICRRELARCDLPEQLRTGVPLQAIDPGEHYGQYVLPHGGNGAAVQKSCCRDVAPCNDATQGCGSCCNRKK